MSGFNSSSFSATDFCWIKFYMGFSGRLSLNNTFIFYIFLVVSRDKKTILIDWYAQMYMTDFWDQNCIRCNNLIEVVVI